jgi:hypothetical protein
MRHWLDYLRWAVGLWSHVGSPHLLKRKVLLNYRRTHRLGVFVETGTFLGDMLGAMAPHFDRVYSVELSESLHRAAVERFAHEPHVQLRQGDSGQVLRAILDELPHPALFWLDAHFSGGVTARGSLDSPILAELDCVLRHPVQGHVLLVDDARLFDGQASYPTVDALRDFVADRRRDYRVDVAQDIIRITPADR